jgi:hypothetical protein
MTQLTINSLFEQTKESWLEEARGVARKLLASKPYITIDDVTAECPLPGYLHKNSIGGVFQTKDFRVVGYGLSTKPSRNGGLIRKWALK